MSVDLTIIVFFFPFSCVCLGESVPSQNLAVASNESERAFLVYAFTQTNSSSTLIFSPIAELPTPTIRRAIFRTKRRKKMMEIAKLGISCQFAHSRKHTRPLIRGKQQTQRDGAQIDSFEMHDSNSRASSQHKTTPGLLINRRKISLGFAFPLCLVRVAYINFHFSLSHIYTHRPRRDRSNICCIISSERAAACACTLHTYTMCCVRVWRPADGEYSRRESTSAWIDYNYIHTSGNQPAKPLILH